MTATQNQITRELAGLPPDYLDIVLDLVKSMRARVRPGQLKTETPVKEESLSQRFRGCLRLSKKRSDAWLAEVREGRDEWDKRITF